MPREILERLRVEKGDTLFVAYYTARCNLRSEFTVSGQQRPFDEIAEVLLARCKRSETANWWAVAQSTIRTRRSWLRARPLKQSPVSRSERLVGGSTTVV